MLQREIENLLTRPWAVRDCLVRELLVPCGQLGQGTSRGGKGRITPGELFPRVGFIVTNLRRDAERVVRFYRARRS